MLKMEDKISFIKGYKAAFPIFLGYLTVAFSIGITAGKYGLTWFQAGLMSFLNHTSAGQAAAIIMIGNDDSFFSVGMSQIIFNLRYLLMSTALALKLRSDTKTGERLLMSYIVSDEIFALSIMRPAPINAWFNIGAMLMVSPGWVFGTILGVLVGEILPLKVFVALSIVLYSMFIAAIIPPAKKDRFILFVIFISMVSSFIFNSIAVFNGLSYGSKAIILTLVISMILAYVRPVEEKDHE